MVRKLLLYVAIFLSAATLLNAQTGAVKGKIVDGDGLPLIGANVVVKGTTNGTITNIDGEYFIQKVPTGEQTLVTSFIGYANEEQVVNVIAGQTATVNFTLIEDIAQLDELVVIGYGKVKKEDATGSVSVVSAKDFNQGNITSPQDLIVGKSAGVVITSDGGAPGSGATIRIRGGSSLTASNDPLIIVDGVPMSENNVGGSSNPLSIINPNDIETFTVLKDASATAIYGSRASNGVILITTKKGKAGKPLSVTYNVSASVQMPISFVDVYTGDEFRAIADEQSAIFDPTLYDLLGTENTDWQKEIFRTSLSHDHSLSLSGAYKFLPYRFSVGYTDQQGILENTDMQRVTSSVSLNPTFFDDALKVNVNAKVMSTNHNYGDEGAIGSAVSMDPTQSINDTMPGLDGYFQWQAYGANLGTPNPVQQALGADNQSDVLKFIGNVQLEYALPFLPELKANLNLATDYANGQGHNNRTATSPNTLLGEYVAGRINTYENINTNHLLDFYVNYNKELGMHSLDITAGYSWQHFTRETSSNTLSVVDTVVPALYDESFNENYLVSFFGRANYGLFDRYLLTGTIRYDGTSRFANNPWGVFPSAAFAWKINKESFMENVAVVSDLKLRLGWGVTGQQNVNENYYAGQAIYTEASEGSYYMINGKFLPTLRPDAYDPDIKWEETTTQNIGFDFGFMEDRITGTFDLYNRVTKDLLNTVTIPSGSNFSNTVLTNVGSLENNGYEIAINAVAVSKPDVSLNIGLNFTHNTNKVTKLLLTDDPEYIGILYGSAFTGTNQVTRVGYPAYSFFVNQQLYDVNGNPIEGLYVDLSEEGGTVSGDNNDKYILHNPAPDYLLGFSFRFSYKDFDLSGSARANIGNYVYNGVAAGASYDQMQQIGYWKNMPVALSDTRFVERQFTSDYFVENASFFRFDNISAGYNLNDIIDKADLRVNFTVQNVLTITKYSGLDPEVNGGIDNNFYPRPRTFTLGLSLNY